MFIISRIRLGELGAITLSKYFKNIYMPFLAIIVYNNKNLEI
jgi:hypothetical protein